MNGRIESVWVARMPDGSGRRFTSAEPFTEHHLGVLRRDGYEIRRVSYWVHDPADIAVAADSEVVHAAAVASADPP